MLKNFLLAYRLLRVIKMFLFYSFLLKFFELKNFVLCFVLFSCSFSVRNRYISCIVDFSYNEWYVDLQFFTTFLRRSVFDLVE